MSDELLEKAIRSIQPEISDEEIAKRIERAREHAKERMRLHEAGACFFCGQGADGG